MSLDAKYLAMPYRCAVYFAPQIHGAWWEAGSTWLGRCAARGQLMTQPRFFGISQESQWAFTSDPRRYGWHATLKAPFKIRPGENLRTVMCALRELARTLPAFDLPPLRVSSAAGFLALRPVGDVSHINRAAAACVIGLHQFASPLSKADLARRRQASLTPEQEKLLMAWGYPYVLDAFEFHFSLTGRVDEMGHDELKAWQSAAKEHFEHLPTCRFDQIALFIEPERGANFQLFEQVELES